jgi:hypothetical protein
MSLEKRFQEYFNSLDNGNWAQTGDNPNPAVQYLNAPFVGKEKVAYLAYSSKRLGARFQNQHNGANLNEHEYGLADAKKSFKKLEW